MFSKAADLFHRGLDILRHAYDLACANKARRGVGGVTFEQIEASGLEDWLIRLGEELRAKTYRLMKLQRRILGCRSRDAIETIVNDPALDFGTIARREKLAERHVRFLAPLAYLARPRLIRPPLQSEPSSETTSANAPASAFCGPVTARMRTGLKEKRTGLAHPPPENSGDWKIGIGDRAHKTAATDPVPSISNLRARMARGIRGSAPHAAKSANFGVSRIPKDLVMGAEVSG